MKVDYFSLIHKYIPPSSLTYQFYLPHVVQVTQMALRIARRLDLPADQQQFLEEASMLHDIGIVKVHSPAIGCDGDAPYIQHGVIGREILEAEGLPEHGLICERHTGVGISIKDIEDQDLPLPKRDMNPQSLEEKILCYADIWFSKHPERIWLKYSVAEIHDWFSRFPDTEEKKLIFDEWYQEFGE